MAQRVRSASSHKASSRKVLVEQSYVTAFVSFVLLFFAAFVAQSQAEEFSGYEFRGGILKHDAGLFSSPREDGVDINLEVLFPSPKVLRYIGSPRPHIGGSYATDSNGTSQGYLGLTWDYYVVERVYLTGALGGAVHTADKLTEEDFAPGEMAEQKILGCRVLFRLAVGLGYQFTERISGQLYADHISNASICDNNEGLEAAGVRFGYKF